MQNCRRCYNETHIIIMSMFSTENICLNCSQKERNHPSYQKRRPLMPIMKQSKMVISISKALGHDI
jgi:hypothetical protein